MKVNSSETKKNSKRKTFDLACNTSETELSSVLRSEIDLDVGGKKSLKKQKDDLAKESKGKGFRYYYNKSQIQCAYCKRIGHNKYNCVEATSCFYCLGRHRRKDCPVFLTCFRCGNEGHTKVECQTEKKAICMKCKRINHTAENCPFLTTTAKIERKQNIAIEKINCLVCNEKGHTNCLELSLSESFLKKRSSDVFHKGINNTNVNIKKFKLYNGK